MISNFQTKKPSAAVINHEIGRAILAGQLKTAITTTQNKMGIKANNAYMYSHSNIDMVVLYHLVEKSNVFLVFH